MDKEEPHYYTGTGGRGGEELCLCLPFTVFYGTESRMPRFPPSRDGYLLELTGWTKGSQAS